MARNVATVEDFEKLKLPDTDLVPMEYLLGTITKRPGDIEGVEPYTALRMYNDGLAQPLGKLSAKPAAEAGAQISAEDQRRGAIAIPDGIGDEHHLKRIAVAKQIVGSDDSLTAEKADEIIAAELARRAETGGVGATGPNTLTSGNTPRAGA